MPILEEGKISPDNPFYGEILSLVLFQTSIFGNIELAKANIDINNALKLKKKLAFNNKFQVPERTVYELDNAKYFEIINFRELHGVLLNNISSNDYFDIQFEYGDIDHDIHHILNPADDDPNNRNPINDTFNLSINIASALLGSSWEKTKDEVVSLWNDPRKSFELNRLSWPSEIQLWRHLRNGCFHGNHFNITGRNPFDLNNPPRWKNYIIDDVEALNGTKVFDVFMPHSMIILFLNDIGKLILEKRKIIQENGS